MSHEAIIALLVLTARLASVIFVSRRHRSPKDLRMSWDNALKRRQEPEQLLSISGERTCPIDGRACEWSKDNLFWRVGTT
jgi:hypothetical protein